MSTAASGHQELPAPAVLGMADWQATVVWSGAPSVTTWRLASPAGAARYVKVAPVTWQPSLAMERKRMLWASSHLPTPRVVAYGDHGDLAWLVTDALPGVNAIDPAWLARPDRLVPLVAAGLRRIHAVPISACPFDERLPYALCLARNRVEQNSVVPERDFQPEHRPLTPEGALAHLEASRPATDDLVVCHGDYCLPNVLLDGGRVSGFVDLGQLGVADRWWDLAIATWSLTWNLGPGWEDLFLESYGIERDASKQAFYRLLHDLYP